MKVQTYLFFEGRCEEALAFYRQTLAAEIGPLMRFRDNPDDPDHTMFPPGAGEMVMHAEMTIGETTVFLSDGRCGGSPNFTGMCLTLVLKKPEEAETLFRALAETGQVRMPLRPTFFSPAFGMVADKFGLGWMIYTEQARPA
ncbi:VOC family protein [Acidisoma cellulosilytica]|uniref:VOC family protein n=1 Tax=Acidisoma cellulosilyticum TaxID=2802395 RepID=A0A963YZU8_9PROT|nr:VOC family protein [Acidisoma cellulosilyticum]MCB8880252.1 VOC family protein [Acidisoma cellulosilyticum]